MTERNDDNIPEFQDTDEYTKLSNALEDVAKMAETREERFRSKKLVMQIFNIYDVEVNCVMII